MDEDFFVLYGDSYLDFDYQNSKFYFKQKTLAVMAIYKNLNKYDISNVLLNEKNLIQYNKSKILKIVYISTTGLVY